MEIKVVEVITDTNIGGAGRLLLTRLRSMRNYSEEITFDEEVIIPQGSELEQELKNSAVKYKTMKCCFDKSFDLRAIFFLFRYLREEKPDIVNMHGCLSGRIAAYLANVPIKIYTRHCAFNPGYFISHFPMKQFNGKITDKLNDKIIAVADAAAENLIDIGVSKNLIEVIINGVEPIKKFDKKEKKKIRMELGIPENAFVCGMCSRLEECKGIDVLLRAAQKLVTNDPNYFFLILGRGSCEDSLKEQAENLGISEKVKFYGFVSDVTPYINCFDVVVNCSRGTETSSLALSEGMSISLPCVVSDWGGNPYMVLDGVNGFVYQTDNFIALAEKIQCLKKDEVLYKEMSEKAYERFCCELNAKKMARKTQDLYYLLFSCHNL